METDITSGAFIPLWILGAGLVAGIIEWMRTPRDVHPRRDTGQGASAIDRAGMPPRTPPMGEPGHAAGQMPPLRR